MSKKIMLWNDQKDEFLCREILLFEPQKFKPRTREKSANSRKAIADNLNSLDGFKVDTRAVREQHCGVIKAHFKGIEKEEKRASGINSEVAPLDTALENLIERERQCAKNFEVEDKKAKQDQELAQSIRQEAVKLFAETKARKFNQSEEDTRPSATKKSKYSGSEMLAYLKDRIEKEAKLKVQELELRNKELGLQERRLQIAQDHQNQLLTKLMTQNNQFLAVISNLTGKKQTLGIKKLHLLFFIFS